MSICCFCILFFFFFKQKTAYEMRISDWSSDVCSSDLSDFRRQFGNRRCFDDIASPDPRLHREGRGLCHTQAVALYRERICDHPGTSAVFASHDRTAINIIQSFVDEAAAPGASEVRPQRHFGRSEAHTSELKELM